MPDAPRDVIDVPQWPTYVHEAGSALLILGHELPERSRAKRNLNGPSRLLVRDWMRVMGVRVPPHMGQGPGSLETARAQLAEAERVLPEAMERATPEQRRAIRAHTRELRDRLAREIRRVEALPTADRWREQVLDVLYRARTHVEAAVGAIGRAGRRVAEGALIGATIGVGTFVAALVGLWLVFKK